MSDTYRFKVLKGTQVWLYRHHTYGDELAVEFTLEKDVIYSPRTDWKTFDKNVDEAKRIKKYIEKKYSVEHYKLEVSDLPANSRGWTHIIYRYEDKKYSKDFFKT